VTATAAIDSVVLAVAFAGGGAAMTIGAMVPWYWRQRRPSAAIA
jgi:hypothetical protein